MQFVRQHKALVIVAVCVIAAAAALFFVLRGIGGGSADAVYVQRVGDLTADAPGMVSRFSGVAEAQKTEKVRFDAQKTIKEIAVAPGDTVHKGDTLFTYDTELMRLNLEQGQLEISSLQDTIASNSAQISQLQQERGSVSGSDRLAYDAQIQQLQAEINSTNYSIKTKQAELDRLKADIENAAVTAPVDGTVETVSDPANPGESDPDVLVTIRNGGDLRIKGSVSEQNIASVTVGDTVLVRSRVDQTQVWHGTIATIDTGSTEQNQSNMYYGGNSGETASFYAFYVDLDNVDGLIMGQHVTIEPDYGQSAAREGLWLNSGFIVQEDGGAFVWAANSRGRLQKQTVTLGEYDEDRDEYEITAGLTEDDLIAWPDETCVAGAPTTTEMVWNDADFEDEGDWGSYEALPMDDMPDTDAAPDTDAVPDADTAPDGAPVG